MTISVGSRLPAATLQQFGANGPEAVDLATLHVPAYAAMWLDVS